MVRPPSGYFDLENIYEEELLSENTSVLSTKGGYLAFNWKKEEGD
jgi:hypothetical protein